MNNLRKFNTEADYQAATLNYPAVSWVTATDSVHFDKAAPVPTCMPTNPNVWVSADPNDFNFSQKVYAIDLGMAYNVADGEGVSLNIFNSPNDATWAYRVSVTKNVDPDVGGFLDYGILIESSMTIVYEDTSESAEIDLCDILGSGFYLKSTDVPSVEVCDHSECTEYECLEYDEETGECIEQGDCITTECVESHTEYPSVVV